MQLEDISIIAWLTQHHMKTETGQPLDFRDHLYLYDIYRDWNPKIVCKKAAQVGFTTLAMYKSTYAVNKRKMDAIYTMPTDDEMKVLVGGKMNRIIAQNPVIQSLTSDKDSIEQKQFGANMIYFRGTWGERSAISHSSDLNIHDEASRSKQDILELFETRLQHSKHQWQWVFSNPAVKGDITDRCWSKSDKKEWFITCPHCSAEQTLVWPYSIDKERRIFVCTTCKGEIDSETRRVGKWKSTAETGAPFEWSGYHISLLMVPRVTAAQIIDKSLTMSSEQFYNFVLGEPYINSKNTVTEGMFQFNSTVNQQVKPIIGCDSGIKKHYVVGNQQGLFYYGVTEDWEDIARLLMRWKDAVLVVDAAPDITGPRMLKERFPGRVFLNYYVKDRKTMKLVRWGEGEEFGKVLSDRNRMLQLCIDEITEGRITFNGDYEDWEPFIKQWLTLYRQDDVDMVGQPMYEWLSSNGNDHFAHALNYHRIGMDRFGHGGGQIISGTSKLPLPQRVSPTVKLDGTMDTTANKIIMPDLKWRGLDQ